MTKTAKPVFFTKALQQLVEAALVLRLTFIRALSGRDASRPERGAGHAEFIDAEQALLLRRGFPAKPPLEWCHQGYMGAGPVEVEVVIYRPQAPQGQRAGMIRGTDLEVDQRLHARAVL